MEIKNNITKMISKYNFSSRRNQKIKYIVIHDTGNRRNGANAMAHAKYFGSRKLNTSAHYFVDDENIVQVVEDGFASWHCGDGYGKNGITNENSIGVEICINCDGDFEKAVENTVFLVIHLLHKYDLRVQDVKRHFDASGKICPRSFHNNEWKMWNEFLVKILKKFPLIR